MANVFLIMLQPEGSRSVKSYKNFDATINSEQRIASALYDGYKKLKGKGTVYITKYYADGYSHWNVENGEFRCIVTDYAEVRDLNHELIGQLFEMYKEGKQKPLVIKEAYDFLREEKSKDLTSLKLPRTFNYDYRTFGTFIADVLAYPQKYSKKVYDICRIVYGNNSSLYGGSITENMLLYPDWLKPKGFIQERKSKNTWVMSAELDGQWITTSVTYDSHSIQEYGPVDEIELAGKLVECYVLYLLEDSYKRFTENNIDYKIVQVVDKISRYIEHVRGVDFRQNYNATGGKMKEPYEFIVDMKELLSIFKDTRFTKNDVYEVINYFKNNRNMFQQYYDKSNKYMEYFYPWFEGRVLRKQKLFKNVPKT